MLATQVQYWANVENKRHNLATEQQAKEELVETQRSHLANEDISRASQQEQARHNLATEEISWFNASEVQRHNQQTEQLGWSTLDESVRHNQAVEGETQRHNVVTEKETTRHNVKTEAQTDVQLAEIARHNRASEQIGWVTASAATRQAAASERQASVSEREVSVKESILPYQQQEYNSKIVKNYSQVGKDVGSFFLTPWGKVAAYSLGVLGANMYDVTSEYSSSGMNGNSIAYGTTSSNGSVYRRGSYQR